MEVKWTPDQKRAIDLPSGEGNILVSAAAGSGKTAVLVERICEKIRLEKRSIDSFLIVTFTTAAASGMKEKIEQRFAEALETVQTPEEHRFWMRQLSLLATADITTIDAFCLNTVKNNFQSIGVDPGFTIMDGAEYELLRRKVAEELFDKLYDEKDASFLDLVEKYADFRSDERLIRLLFNIYDFISEFAEPLGWLDEKASWYTEDMTKSPWVRLCIDGLVKAAARDALNESERLLNEILYTATGLDENFWEAKNAAEAAREDYGRITDSLELIRGAMLELINIDSIEELCGWNRRYSCGSSLLAENMPARITNSLREIDGFEGFMKRTKNLKADTESALSVMAITRPEEFCAPEKAARLAKTAAEIAELVRKFDGELSKAVHKKSAYTFLDIEHMTYKLFRDNEDIRRNYADKYSEILIDEYQDTNGLQDAIFEKISHGNIFMVGDLKQSIYRFRGGDPYIFKEKSRLYDKGEGGKKVTLARNFRSRGEVIDSINDVFDVIMSERVGDVDYSGGERLVCGAGGGGEGFYRSEMHVIAKRKETGDDEELETAEAEYVAARIKELHGREIFDSKINACRPLKYSDFTILFRARSSARVYGAVFEKHNIPFYAEINDYFKNSEVKAVTALLDTIDNVRRDVPLVTSLRSAIFNFTDSELAYIKIHFGKDGTCFYDALKSCAEGGGHLSGRCKNAVSSIERWREYTKRKSAANLIWSIYEESGFYDAASAAGGETAQINLRLLYERAKQYENSGFKGLFSFTRYLENLRGRRDDMAGARVMRHDVVSLMTVHKSKGLEFPIVFVVGLGKRSLRKSSGDGRAVLHKELGMGLAYPETEHGFYGITPFKMLVSEQNGREDMSENMRLLYVALTRARCKLIATAAYNMLDDEELSFRLKNWKAAAERGKMKESAVMSAQTYGDWIIPAALRSVNWDVTSLFAEPAGEAPEEDEEAAMRVTDSDELYASVCRLLDYKYPYPESTVLPSRTTATEMKEMRREKERYPAAVVSAPAFLSGAEDAAKRGTAYHNFAAYIDLGVLRRELSEKSIAAELKRLTDEGYVDARFADGEMVKKLLELFKSREGRRILNAKKVYREKNFQMLMSADEYTGVKGSGENMILQGVIDCFFTEDGKTAVLMDYKTDKIKNGDVSEAVENYTLQLKLYSEAIERVAGLKVTERYLYLFDINKAVKI